MKRTLAIILTVVLGAALTCVLYTPAKCDYSMAWKQTDWSGGPGQSQWSDSNGYSASDRVDTNNVPGSMRLSFLSGDFTKDNSNPVIHKGAAGAWDHRYVVGYPWKKAAGGYEVLYRGTDDAGVNAIGYAESDDGVTWNKYSANPVLKRSGEAWDGQGVQVGSLAKDGDTYYLFFLGADVPGGESSVGLATSEDLKHWSRRTDPVLKPGPAGSWDEQTIESITALKVGATFHIWYLARNFGGVIAAVGHATSDGGAIWVKDPANPVLSPGAPGSFDDTNILGFEILRRPWAGDFLMAYLGSRVGAFGIGIATSSNGSHWIKDSGNPKFSTGAPNWFSDYVAPHNLTFDGSIYKLQLYGGKVGIGLSSGEVWSEDGSNWQANPHNPLLTPGPTVWDSAATQTSRIYVEGDGLRVFYVGNPPMPCYTVGTATATPSYNASGTLTSSVYDALAQVGWGSVSWTEVKLAGTGVKVEVRGGNTAVPDASWSSWTAATNGGAFPLGASRYLQYRVTLSTGHTNVTPEVLDITFKPGKSWYLAEGSTGTNEYGSFETWVLVQNPGDDKAEVDLFYQTPAGEKKGPHISVGAHTRTTVNVADVVPNEFSVSTRVTSDNPVIAERAMYWNTPSVVRQAATDSIGCDP